MLQKNSKTHNSANNKVAVHVPMRTCIVCKACLPKKELLRLIRKQATVLVDQDKNMAIINSAELQSGNKISQQNTFLNGFVADQANVLSGRGYYVCSQTNCWEKLSKPSKAKVCRRLGKVQAVPANAASKRG